MRAAQTRFLVLAFSTTLAVLASFWLVTVVLPMGFMPQEYAMWRTRLDMIDRCQLGPVVIQGDSRAAAGFVPEEIGGAVNVAFGGASPVETYYASQAILKCKPPERVIVSISPNLFVGSSYFWDRSVLFGALSFEQLEEIRKNSRRLEDRTFYGAPKFQDLEAILDNGLHAARFPSYYSSYILNHLVMGRWSDNRKAQDQTLANLGQHGYGTADGSSDLADESDMKAFKPSVLFNYYFERFLSDYAAQGTRVDFVGVPMNRATFEHMNPEVAEGFQRYLNQLAASHPNFHVQGRAVQVMDNAYFGDSTHLNTGGAKVFSDQVRARMANPDASP